MACVITLMHWLGEEDRLLFSFDLIWKRPKKRKEAFSCVCKHIWVIFFRNRRVRSLNTDMFILIDKCTAVKKGQEMDECRKIWCTLNFIDVQASEPFSGIAVEKGVLQHSAAGVRGRLAARCHGCYADLSFAHKSAHKRTTFSKSTPIEGIHKTVHSREWRRIQKAYLFFLFLNINLTFPHNNKYLIALNLPKHTFILLKCCLRYLGNLPGI